MTLRRIRWILFLTAAASFAGLQYYMMTVLVPGAGGLMPFDVRPFGYSVDDVQQYLAALSPEAFAVYTGPVAWIDTIFPVALALWLAFIALGGRAIAWLGGLMALAYGGIDLAENAEVARLLTTPMLVDPDVAAQASQLTMLKFAVLVAAAAFVLYGRFKR